MKFKRENRVAPKRQGLVYRLKPEIIVNDGYFVADRSFYYIFRNFEMRADLIFSDAENSTNSGCGSIYDGEDTNSGCFGMSETGECVITNTDCVSLTCSGKDFYFFTHKNQKV